MKKFTFKGVKFLLVVVFIYAFTAFVNAEATLISLKSSLTILYSLIPIFIFIITITALINYFVKPKHIIKHLGEDSGVKGLFYAIISGVLIHGPLYMWYGVIKEIREGGAKEQLLITFLFARAVKLPLLVFMIDLFGLGFTLIMTLFTLIASVVQGYLFTYINKRF